MDCLEQSNTAASSSEALNWIENDPDLDPLRDHPRFQALIGKIQSAD